MEPRIYAKGAALGDGKTTSFPATPGDTLANSAILIAERDIMVETMTNGLPVRKSIVLAMNPGSTEPYIVWRREVAVIRRNDDWYPYSLDDVCFYGQYSTSIDNAVAEFGRR